MKTAVVVFAFIVVSLFYMFDSSKWKQNVFVSDTGGYYLYLPALLIYQDADFHFLQDIKKKYYPPDDEQWYVYPQRETGHNLNKYAVGTAVSELPLFLVAHTYCRLTSAYPADGYSEPYRLSVIVTTLLWAFLGLVVLKRFLENFFSNRNLLYTPICLFAGTNLLYYSYYDIGLSHTFSFFLIATVLYLTHKWYRKFDMKTALLLGVVIGLIGITRPINLVIVLVPVFWNVYNLHSLGERFRFFKQHLYSVFAVAIVAIVIFFLQLSYWKYTTGEWLCFSYQHEYFDFSDPHVLKGLFSYRKGWFVYTPLAFISVLGFYSLWKKHRVVVPAILVTLCLAFYLIFSWKMWWYGGSFGCRVLIDFLPLMALPLEALKADLFSRRIGKAVLIACTVAVITLNAFQTYQYSRSIIHWDRMSKASYWHVFGKTKMSFEEYEPYLLSEKDYWTEMGEVAKP